MLNFLLFLFLGTLGWGVSLYLIKILLVSLTPTEIVLYRGLIGAFFLFILTLLLRLKPIKWRDLLQDGIVVGLFNMAVPFYLTSLAEKTVPSALASVLNALTPLCAFILSFGFLASRPAFTFLHFLSLGLGLSGVILVNFDALQGQGEVLHILAMVVTCFSYGLAAHYLKSSARCSEPILVAAVAASCSSLVMLGFQGYSRPHLPWGYPLDWFQWSALLWLGLVGTGLSLFLYCVLIRRVGAVLASMTTYLMTITGVVLGIAFLGERLSIVVILGCLCIIISLLLISHPATVASFFSRLHSSLHRYSAGLRTDTNSRRFSASRNGNTSGCGEGCACAICLRTAIPAKSD
jgi:drug/metabolite transporter (DMT)-like permease